ncbi:hypothetical protein BRPE64_ACDS00080 [Caballeronia insecticola]|uniref:Right handed beta helix domain-containing protein n=1 Tax=Caballeronia insecticola TaxID=758793 RepID=R4WV52_9BURK|nr:hypothetical protein BRPE64_ACDS00080 [Caballeronia insecticola]
MDAPNEFLAGHQYRFQDQDDEALLIFEGDTPSDAGASTLAAGDEYTVTYRNGAIWAKSSDALSVVGIEDLGPETGNTIDGGTTALLKQNFAAANAIAASQDEPASQTDQAATYGQLQDALAQFNGPDGASLIGYQRNAPGTMLLDLQSKLDQVVDMRDWPIRADDNDHTADIQNALDEISRVGGVLKGAPGTLNCGNLRLTGSGVKLDLAGTTLKFHGTAAAGSKLGLQLFGTVDALHVCGGRFICDGVLANGHAGIWSNSGIVASNVFIYRNYVKNGINGISCNANLSGSFRNARIFQNVIDGTVGVDSGAGYGIHFADGSGQPIGAQIFENHIINATRHSIYFARGIGGNVFGNQIYGHRSTVADGSIRPAINALRCSDVNVFDNTFCEPNDGGMMIGRTGANGLRNRAYGNTFKKSAASNSVPCLMIGSQNPAAIITDQGDPSVGQPEGAPSSTTVENNHFDIDNNTCDPIRVYCGIGVKIKGNTGNVSNVAVGSQAIYVYGTGGDTYNANHDFEDNSFQLPPSAVIARLEAGLVGTTFAMRFRRNNSDYGVPAFACAVAMNNPNIGIFEQSASGLSMSSGIYPKGRYAMKSIQPFGPVTVPGSTSSSLGTLTTNFSIAGVKKGDQASVSFDQIGTAIEVMSAYVNSNNNVRVILLNLAPTSTALPAGNVDIEVRRNTVDY